MHVFHEFTTAPDKDGDNVTFDASYDPERSALFVTTSRPGGAWVSLKDARTLRDRLNAMLGVEAPTNVVTRLRSFEDMKDEGDYMVRAGAVVVLSEYDYPNTENDLELIYALVTEDGPVDLRDGEPIYSPADWYVVKELTLAEAAAAIAA
jgi:hypothetical protein